MNAYKPTVTINGKDVTAQLAGQENLINLLYASIRVYPKEVKKAAETLDELLASGKDQQAIISVDTANGTHLAPVSEVRKALRDALNSKASSITHNKKGKKAGTQKSDKKLVLDF